MSRVQIDYADSIGDSRQNECLSQGLPNIHGAKLTEPEQRARHRLGACTEYCFSLWSGLPWTNQVMAGRSWREFKSVPDVAPYEVRHTTYSYGKLIVRDDDPMDRPYVLLTGDLPRFYIRGWLFGHEVIAIGRYESIDKDRPKAHVAYQNELNPRFPDVLKTLDTGDLFKPPEPTWATEWADDVPE